MEVAQTIKRPRKEIGAAGVRCPVPRCSHIVALGVDRCQCRLLFEPGQLGPALLDESTIVRCMLLAYPQLILWLAAELFQRILPQQLMERVTTALCIMG